MEDTVWPVVPDQSDDNEATYGRDSRDEQLDAMHARLPPDQLGPRRRLHSPWHRRQRLAGLEPPTVCLHRGRGQGHAVLGLVPDGLLRRFRRLQPPHRRGGVECHDGRAGAMAAGTVRGGELGAVGRSVQHPDAAIPRRSRGVAGPQGVGSSE